MSKVRCSGCGIVVRTTILPLRCRCGAVTTKFHVIGLGDVIEHLLWVPGQWYKRLHKWWFGKDCGCDKRKQQLNERFPLG